MSAPARLLNLSPEEYLEREKNSPVRHEYVDGNVYARLGESKNHARIAGNMVWLLSLHLDESKYESFISTVKVKVSPNQYYYPDVVVECKASEVADDEYLIFHPILLVEVLSPSTKRTDKVEKFNAYQQIVGLREYIIVAQDQMRVEVYRHEKAGDVWQGQVFTEAEQEVTLQSVGLTVNLATIYRRVIFPPPTEGEPNQ